MLKRLWMIFGPVLIAGLLVFLLIFFYPTEMHHNLGAEKRSAVATTIDSLLLLSIVLRSEVKKSEHYLIQMCVLFPSLALVNGFVLTVLILRY